MADVAYAALNGLCRSPGRPRGSPRRRPRWGRSWRRRGGGQSEHEDGSEHAERT
jgi:hypothetical protein